MEDSSAKKFQKDLNGGLVGLVLLAVLDRSAEDLYGYEIAKRLASANDGTSIFKEGSLYPVLRALSAQELLTSRIVPSYSGPPRRYYRITDQGRAVLAEWKAIWRSTVSFVRGLPGSSAATWMCVSLRQVRRFTCLCSSPERSSPAVTHMPRRAMARSASMVSSALLM